MPPRATSCSCVPCSAIRPPSTTTIRSAIRTVEKRCETKMAIPPVARATARADSAYRTASRKRIRSRTEERLVHCADRSRIGLRPPVVGQQAVLLLLDVGQLRPAEAGHVVRNLLDDRAVAVGEVVDVPVDEVAAADRQAAELPEPERNVVALPAVSCQLRAVVVDVDEVGVV